MAWTIHNIHNAAFGRDARFAVADMLGEFDVHNVALLYDRALEPLGFVSEMVDIIEKGGYTVYTYMTAEDEPVSSELDKFVDFCRGHGVDALVSLGGSSTIDTTKLAGKVLANGGKTTDYLGGYTALNVGSKVFEPIIAIPTTAGTGSESCWGIMCLNEETGIKTFTRHPVTRAVVDPVYTMKLPAEITAYTGMDALAQAAECLVNTRAMPNWMADVLAREALADAIKYLPIAVHEPDNLEARERMCWAAMLSGYAITLRKTSSGHAVANQLSDKYHLAHGIGVGIGMAALARYNVTGDPDTTRVWAPFFGVDEPDVTRAGELIVQKLDALQKDIGMPNMKQLGIPESFCDECADGIAKDKKWTIVPNPPDFELLRRCLHESWDY